MNKSFHQVVYQIYPRSFQDSNQDGIGDLKGIIQRLDYLAFLNVDLIWLSPIYLSHQHDYGYDIDDYYTIDPSMGTMADFEELVREAKQRGIGILMDMVANHTSIYHHWYKEALADKNSPYRDYYYFRKGNGKNPPNNWLSAFGGSAWQPVGDDEYVLTMFSPQQVDLNWKNEAMRHDIYAAMRFWMDKGIAGFRLDVINIIAKKDGLPSVETRSKALQFPEKLICSLPDSHRYIQEMNREVFAHYPDCFTVGEGMLVSLEDTKLFSGRERHELNMMFQFDLSLIGCGPLGKYDFRKGFYWNVSDFKAVVRKWQNELNNHDFWIGNYLSNHDFPRQVSRFGDDKKYRVESAKALGLLNMTLIGTPFIFQGEEIGMTNCKFKRDEWRDYEAKHDYEVLQSMMHLPAKVAEAIINKMTRDHARTPMQWDNSSNAGFSDVKPWIKVNENYTQISVMDQLMKQNSILGFYKLMIDLYHQHPVFANGQYYELCEKHPKVIAYRRFDETENLAVFINLSKSETPIYFPEEMADAAILLSNYTDTRLSVEVKLRPYEAFVVDLG